MQGFHSMGFESEGVVWVLELVWLKSYRLSLQTSLSCIFITTTIQQF